jgi:hypothetical protein
MDKRLYQACEICVADMGKEDDELVKKLYDKVMEKYVEKGKPWNYGLIDRILSKMVGK